MSVVKKNKKSFFNILSSQKIVALVIVLGLFLLVPPLVKNIKQRHSVNEEIAELKEEIDRVGGKNNDLQKLIGYLESEQFTEEQARTNFGLKKEGEKVVVVQDDNLLTESAGGGDVVFNIPGLSHIKPEKEETNPQKWFKYFFNN